MRQIRFAIALPVLWLMIFWGMGLTYWAKQAAAETQGNRFMSKYYYFACIPLERPRSEWPMRDGKPGREWADDPNGWDCWSSNWERLFIFPNLPAFAGFSLISYSFSTMGETRHVLVKWFYVGMSTQVFLQWWLIGFAVDLRRLKKQNHP